MSENSTYMLKTGLDRARLFEFGRSRRLPLRDVDIGYLVHCALRAIFGERAPQPFTWKEVQRGIEILGYCDDPAEALLEHARAVADPGDWSVCLAAETVSKPMPHGFRQGARYEFEVRACPIVRKSSDGPRHRKGAEVDVFLSHCWSVGSDVTVDRESVYLDWLSSQLKQDRAASVLNAKMVAFRRQRLARNTHGPGAIRGAGERPDALLRGTLEVGDEESFQRMLRRGIGRHRAFGFGMLLLKPRRPDSC